MMPVLAVANLPGAMALEHSGPLRLWGSLETNYRQFDRAGGDSSDRWLNTGSISASSYIWRPWFAIVNGGLSLSVVENRGDNQADSDEEYATGDLNLSVFPTSRFPFSAYVSESRDEFDAETFESTTRTTEYGLSQQYRSRSGRQNYRAEYENKDQSFADGERFDSDILILEANHRAGDNLIDTDLGVDQVENTTLGERVERQRFAIDHSYQGSRDFSLDNLFTLTSNESDLTDSRREFDTGQLSSFLSWNPQGRRDLRLTGSLRLNQRETLEERLDNGFSETARTDTDTLNLNQGLTYNYSDNLKLGESINANWETNNGADQFIASESLSALYIGDLREIDWGGYVWNVSTTYTNRHGDIESEYSLDSRFRHSLSNDFSAPGRYRLQTTLSQGFVYDTLSAQADEKSLDHSYSLTWSNSSAANRNLVRMTVSDSRELNRENDYFQLLNLQYNGDLRLSRNAQFDGVATLQLTRRQQSGLDSRERFANGEIEYRHSRAFGIIGMSFNSKLRLSRRLSEAEQALRDQDSGTSVSLENELRYLIGRLEIETGLDLIKVGSDYDRIFTFRLNRSFGDL